MYYNKNDDINTKYIINRRIYIIIIVKREIVLQVLLLLDKKFWNYKERIINLKKKKIIIFIQIY